MSRVLRSPQLAPVTHRAHQPNPRAVLIFAGSLQLDLARRKWPRYFQRFLALPLIDGDVPCGADLHVFTSSESVSAGCPGASVTIHKQTGRTFGENLREAVEKLAALGYAEIALVGRDCPDLAAVDIAQAFSLLSKKRLVLGPDHRGGVYLIALRAVDLDLLLGIRWQQNTDCAQLRGRLGADHTALLPVKLDLDSFADLFLLARGRGLWSEVARRMLQSLRSAFVSSVPHVPEGGRRFEVIAWQLPPPRAC